MKSIHLRILLTLTLALVVFPVLAPSPTLALTSEDDTSSDYSCPAITQDLIRYDCDQGITGPFCKRTIPNGQVSELQEFLMSYYPQNQLLSASGKFLNGTRAAVRQFQIEQKLIQPWEIGGKVGAITRAKIQEVCSSAAETPTPKNTTFQATPGSSPLEIVFSVQAGDEESFSVDFGDGQTSPMTVASGGAQRSVRHTYASPGTYTAILMKKYVCVPFAGLNCPALDSYEVARKVVTVGGYVPTYSWSTSDWGSCANNQQTRTVQCKSNTGAVVADSMCTGAKPVTSQTCSSSAVPGSGGMGN